MNFKIISLSILAAASAQGVVVGTWATDWLNPDTTTGGITAGAAALGGGLVAQAFETVDPAGNHTFVAGFPASGFMVLLTQEIPSQPP